MRLPRVPVLPSTRMQSNNQSPSFTWCKNVSHSHLHRPSSPASSYSVIRTENTKVPGQSGTRYDCKSVGITAKCLQSGTHGLPMLLPLLFPFWDARILPGILLPQLLSAVYAKAWNWVTQVRGGVLCPGPCRCVPYRMDSDSATQQTHKWQHTLEEVKSFFISLCRLHF